MNLFLSLLRQQGGCGVSFLCVPVGLHGWVPAIAASRDDARTSSAHSHDGFFVKTASIPADSVISSGFVDGASLDASFQPPNFARSPKYSTCWPPPRRRIRASRRSAIREQAISASASTDQSHSEQMRRVVERHLARRPGSLSGEPVRCTERDVHAGRFQHLAQRLRGFREADHQLPRQGRTTERGQDAVVVECAASPRGGAGFQPRDDRGVDRRVDCLWRSGECQAVPDEAHGRHGDDSAARARHPYRRRRVDVHDSVTAARFAGRALRDGDLSMRCGITACVSTRCSSTRSDA